MRIIIGDVTIFVDKKDSNHYEVEVANSLSRKKLVLLTLEEKANGIFVETNHQFSSQSCIHVSSHEGRIQCLECNLHNLDHHMK
ncbi:hypothetical protein [Bacillus sp. Fil]|uniref:hypothetical protein n=1 Tax=Bacillus sp. Fil TaxID=3459567 RepID=UPI00403B1B32